MINNQQQKTATTLKTTVRIGGYALFALGIFFTIGAILVLPFVFVILFAMLIVAGIVMIRWGNNKNKKKEEEGVKP